MKNLLSLFCLILFLSACPKPNNSDDPIVGKWHMESYSAFMPEQPVINEGDIIWIFDSGAKNLKIINNIEDQYPFIPKSGDYDYTTSNSGKLNFDGRSYDYRFESSKLIVSDKPELDGPMISFVKAD